MLHPPCGRRRDAGLRQGMASAHIIGNVCVEWPHLSGDTRDSLFEVFRAFCHVIMLHVQNLSEAGG